METEEHNNVNSFENAASLKSKIPQMRCSFHTRDSLYGRETKHWKKSMKGSCG